MLSLFVLTEVIEGEAYTKLVDVFSYGVCVWEMIVRGAVNPLTGLAAMKVN